MMDAQTVEAAACIGHHPTMFADASHHTAAEAIQICHTCPIIDRCRRDHENEPHGVWYGTTPNDRGYRRTEGGVSHRVTARDAVAAVLAASPTRRFTCGQLVEWLDGAHKRAAVQKALQRLTSIGEVERIARPNGRPWLYRWVS